MLAVNWSVERRSRSCASSRSFFFFQAEDGIRDLIVTGVQTCALPISHAHCRLPLAGVRRRRGFPLLESVRARGAVPRRPARRRRGARPPGELGAGGSEEHTSEIQSRSDIVCRLLLEKKKKKKYKT